MDLKRKTVCVVITSLRPAGAERQLVYIACGLRSQGVDVRIVLLQDVNEFTKELDAAGVEVVAVAPAKSRNVVRMLLNTIKVFRDWRPNTVVTFLYHADVIGRIAARTTRVPHVIASYRNEQFGGAFRTLVLRTLRTIPKLFIVNFSGATQSFVDARLAIEGRVRIIPNGIHTDCSLVKEPERQGVRRDIFTWLAIGRLEKQKDYVTLLQAFSDSRIAPAKLIVCGDGRLKRELMETALHMGLGSDSVEFVGFQSDVSSYLLRADAYVLSSAWEGMPNALMEAMCHGLPSVVTAVGGVPDLITEGETGFMVPPKQPKELTTAMLRMMALSVAERVTMGRRARARIKNGFSVQSTVEQWYKALQDVENY